MVGATVVGATVVGATVVGGVVAGTVVAAVDGGKVTVVLSLLPGVLSAGSCLSRSKAQSSTNSKMRSALIRINDKRNNFRFIAFCQRNRVIS